MKYDLEIEKAISQIKKIKAKLVCIQLPDGLQPEADKIQKEIEKNTKAKVIIWFGTCFGACDVPEHIEKLGSDMLIQWGHEKWKY